MTVAGSVPGYTGGRGDNFVAGSVSLGMFKHDHLGATKSIEMMISQTQEAEASGYDGVTFSEHHAGERGYFPNPIMAANIVLDRTSRIWSGTMPMLSTLRPPLILAEDIAWLAAAHPGRLVVCFAAGKTPKELELISQDSSDFVKRFALGLDVLAAELGTIDAIRVLGDDTAISAVRGVVPLLTAARSSVAVRRAARLGMGLLLSPTLPPETTKRHVEEYREAGGSGPCTLIRQLWLEGLDPKRDAELRGSNKVGHVYGSAETIIEQLLSLVSLTGGDSYSLRVHSLQSFESPDLVAEQIRRIGHQVVGAVKTGLSGSLSG